MALCADLVPGGGLISGKQPVVESFLHALIPVTCSFIHSLLMDT